MLAHLRLRSSTQGSTPSIPINSIPGACRAGPRKHENVGPWEVSHCRDVPLATLCQNYAKNNPKKIMNLLSSQRKGRDALEATQNTQRSYSTDCYSSSCRKATVVMERRNDLLIVGRYGAAAFHQVLEDAGIQWAEGLGGQSCLRFPIKGGNWMHLRFQCDFLEQI